MNKTLKQTLIAMATASLGLTAGCATAGDAARSSKTYEAREAARESAEEAEEKAEEAEEEALEANEEAAEEAEEEAEEAEEEAEEHTCGEGTCGSK